MLNVAHSLMVQYAKTLKTVQDVKVVFCHGLASKADLWSLYRVLYLSGCPSKVSMLNVAHSLMVQYAKILKTVQDVKVVFYHGLASKADLWSLYQVLYLSGCLSKVCKYCCMKWGAMHLSCRILISWLFVSGMESGAMAQLQALHTLQGMGGIQVHAPLPPSTPCTATCSSWYTGVSSIHSAHKLDSLYLAHCQTCLLLLPSGLLPHGFLLVSDTS